MEIRWTFPVNAEKSTVRNYQLGKVRKFVFWLITLTVGLVLSGLAAEGVLRLLGTPTRDLHTVNENQFHKIPGIYEPVQEVVRTKNRHLPYKVSINTLGYRGYDIPLVKPEGEKRILMAGDSFVFGEFVEEDETMPSQLELLLQARCAHVQVINAGLLGGTITGETRLIERGLVLEPDLVVLVFHENDIKNLSAPLWLELARNRVTKSQFPMSLIYPLMRDTAIWNFAMQIRGKIRAERGAKAAQNSESGIKENSVKPAERGDSNDFRETYRKELRYLRDLLWTRDVAFMFVIFPGHHAMKGRESQLEKVQWAEGIAENLGIPTLNLLGPLRDSLTPSAAYLLPWDGHPSAKGHSVAARAVSKYLLELEPIRSSCQ